MRIKNAFKLLISNSAVIYKSMFFKLVISSIIALISYFVIAKDIGYLLHSEEVLNLWDAIRSTASKFFAGQGFDKELVPDAFDGVLAMLRLNALDISYSLAIGVYLETLLAVFLAFFLDLG